jgi:AcrR family transcriptional regulator
VKNTHARHVQKRTSIHRCPETPDRRVQRTRTSLRDALIGLAREKPYDAIAVKEILHRANVGRSTFYTHFRDKDELLASGIQEIVRSRRAGECEANGAEQLLAFSLPFLELVDQHRHADSDRSTHNSYSVLHAHLRDVITEIVADDLERMGRPNTTRTVDIPVVLVARQVASTFVLVLDWWVENEAQLTPAEVDARFRALLLPTLTTL